MMSCEGTAVPWGLRLHDVPLPYLAVLARRGRGGTRYAKLQTRMKEGGEMREDEEQLIVADDRSRFETWSGGC